MRGRLLFAVVALLALVGPVRAAITQDFDLDETSGTSAVNDVGATTGTYARDASNTTTAGPGGTLGTMQEFNGSSDVVSLSGTTSIRGTGTAGSFAAWVKFDQASGPLFGTTGGGNNRFQKVNDTRFQVVVGSGGGATYDFAAGIGTSAWRHVALTFAADNSSHVYLDGVDSDNGAVSRSSSLSCNSLGLTNTTYLDGKIGGVRFYNHELSQAEVLALVAEGVDGGGGSSIVLKILQLHSALDRNRLPWIWAPPLSPTSPWRLISIR